ncbi:3'-5' exonuclease [Patescibacteria group bacterium]|nr:3'-5' exonuclease [Patescibacteria group bacterium]MBU1123041.1 3'-5' exonuclease [Patescibacteria group bacterium]MBU1911069.1 3'-5' exonuclease [Patescibacteria group bacterium]
MLPALTVFDVETTGLDPNRGHKIIEIGAIRIEEGKILEANPFDMLVNPERPIPIEASQVNKIRNEDVISAPTIDQVLPQFLDFASNSLLVAHNANFDMGFLTKEKELCWGFIDLPECLCTLRLSRSLYPTEFRHSLDVVALRLGIELPAVRHRALPDVLLTAQALLRMVEGGDIGSIEDLRVKAGVRQMAK